mgnify:FL=1
MKVKAVWVECAGVTNEGKSGHAMRDYCWSCAPFWEKFPTCPKHEKMLTDKGYCKICKKFYKL